MRALHGLPVPDLVSASDFTLGDLVVRPSSGSITANGATLRVEPKVMEMLIALAHASGRTLSRDQLIAQCWGGRIVSDDAVTRTLGKVRQLAVLSHPPAFKIETVPKIGVRLVIAEPIPVLANPEPVLIVLPFDNFGGEAALDFFCDGVAEDILVRLVRGSTLTVVGRTTSFNYRGPRKTAAASEVGASHVVDGSIQRAGGRVRINVHLTEVKTGAALWAQRYDGELEDIFKLQDEIAEQIARALDTVLTLPNKPAISSAAYDLYLRAKHAAASPETIRANVVSLEAVVAEAPGFADGWAKLAAMRAWANLQLPFAQRASEADKARDAIARCRALDPTNPETGYAEFWLAAPFGDYVSREACVQKILANNPNGGDAHTLAAFHLVSVGRCREALVHARKAKALDPRDWSASMNYAMALWSCGLVKEAIAAFEANLQEWPDDNMNAAVLIIACAREGLWSRLESLIEPSRLQKYPLREHEGIVAVACTMQFPTPENKAMLLQGLQSRIRKTGGADPIVLFWSSHLGLGDAVFDMMKTARFGPTGQRGELTGVIAYSTVTMFKAAFPALWQDPRFCNYCARLGLVSYWLETDQWPDCADEVDYDFRKACQAARAIPLDYAPEI
jgi:TolB-like protein/DNA-binding winged helix-turn-helix (wHTH) protein/cytochrome c-type biogenesis protein CcmH/NrfG